MIANLRYFGALLIILVLDVACGVCWTGVRASIIPASHNEGSEFNFASFKIINGFLDTGKRFIDGFSGLPKQFGTYIAMKRRIKDDGMESLSYSDFKFMERTGDDFLKCIRITLLGCLSPELVAYSYVIIPAISSQNPWAWNTLPSSFDRAKDKDTRDKAMIQRRQIASLHAMDKLMERQYADVYNNKEKVKHTSQISKIVKGLTSSDVSLESAMKELKPLFGKTKNTIQDIRRVNKGTMSLDIRQMPWPVVRDLCKSIGVDGVPNIFFLRRLNKGDLGRYFDNLRKSDRHIALIGVDALDDREIVDACFERGIGNNNKRKISDMRKDMNEWLSLVDQFSTQKMSTSKPKPSKVIYNEQNVRLALSALHTARNLRQSNFAHPMRALCGGKD